MIKVKNKAKFRKVEEQRIAERRKIVASLYVRGSSQWEIAKSLVPPVTQKTVSEDLKAVREEWLKTATQDYDALKAKELAAIDDLQEECWRQFRLSCKVRAKTVKLEKELKLPKIDLTKNAGKGSIPFPKSKVDPLPDPVMTTTKIGKDYRYPATGNPAWLDRIQWCVEMRCKIFGLIKPPDVTNNNTVNVANLSWDAVRPVEKPPVEERIRALERMQTPMQVEDGQI